MKNLKSILKFITPLIIPGLSFLITYFALLNAIKIRDISYELNKISKESNEIALKANEIANESVMQTTEANKLSLNANELTKKAVSESLIKANEANSIAKNSNNIAEKSLLQSERALAEATKYAEINAQVMWNSLKNEYDSADREVQEWEKTNNFKRTAQPVKTTKELMNYLIKLNISEEGKRLYLNRFDKRMSLIKASEAYEPFKERLSSIDFTLPSPPLLPGKLLLESGGMFRMENGKSLKFE